MQEPSVLQGEQPDPEMFRRVWERVMEGRTESPIQVEKPGEAAEEGREEPKAGPRPAAEESTGKEQPANQGPGTAETLKRLMELAWEGAAAGRQLSQRMGGANRPLAQLAADHRSALRRLGTAYFLETGERYIPQAGRPGPIRNGPLNRALREQYLWEGEWEKVCRRAAEQWEEASLRELCLDLAQDAALHARTIRRVLERM